jgi:hypothetical protein
MKTHSFQFNGFQNWKITQRPHQGEYPRPMWCLPINANCQIFYVGAMLHHLRHQIKTQNHNSNCNDDFGWKVMHHRKQCVVSITLSP